MAESTFTKVVKHNEASVIVLNGLCKHVDETNVDQVGRELMDAVTAAVPPKVAVDLSATDFFGSSFIEVLFRLWNRLQHKPGGKLVLVGLRPYCREVLEITHLDKLWAICETQADAVTALSAQ